ncbi:MAG: hypothetical protein K9K65_11445 [Desulfarculaceae bacterium]|nr:hypothetical protein [Desulfarculaceae bacterium]MCF8048361.1 hypothetical protein [Desulfarculaceae bacterium]MCF8066215.1 hypothetical protein [Desulfarculaceae bacterium]MCF8098448.1 hypothetical protein [Desulfarculaceae bacterium]MCF8123889.1 hypothetical protein [Desulfarculaceae bacterium]
MSDKVDAGNYVWVIVERTRNDENFLGMADEDGDMFIPVTAEKDQALMLVGRLPDTEGVFTRSVEAIHRAQLLGQAQDEGFSVYLVDEKGRIIEHLTGQTH